MQGVFGKEKVSLSSLARHHKVRVQTVTRPPSRKEVELWGKARRLINQEKKGEKKEEEAENVNQTQHVKLRIRRDSDDSMGSELTCSLPSSPDTPESVPRHSPPDTANTSTPGPLDFSRILSVSPAMDMSPVVIKSPTTSQVSIKPSLKRRRISWDLTVQTDFDQCPTAANPSPSEPSTSTQTHFIKSGDTTASLAARLASPGYRAQFLTPQAKRLCKSQIEAQSPATPQALVDLGKAVKDTSTRSHLTMLSLELHVETRQQLQADPEFDQVVAAFYRLVIEGEEERGVGGCIVVGPTGVLEQAGVTSVKVRYVNTEQDLVRHLVKLVRECDPDILGGYEVQMSSWGYLMARAAVLGTNLCPLLSRVPSSVRESKMAGLGEEGVDNPGAQYSADHTSEITLVGRNVFNIWRLLRAELALYSYTLENVAKVVLGERRPCFSTSSLTKWWRMGKTRGRVVEHYVSYLETYTNILYRLDLLSRTSELARLFGIQLFEVFSRGSQFRVESSMLRLAKPRNYVPVSPTRQQLGGQAAPEYLALLLEPESRMYTDPVVVLDFQSLYPSIMIGYNYCFTTCLGRLQHLGSPGPYEFGCTQLRVSPERLEALKNNITISPGGIVFLKASVRRGILPKMLEDILSTRVMVKQSMKKHKKDPQLQKILHSRQLGLKLIANVTYGYTSANFSGRMPCIEVGDSVVAKGREALERCIKTVESNPKWGAKVVYGDTDSVFVLLKGKSKEEAFDIGEEMAKVVTLDNPPPMKLKFEKVYLPCILQTKKRYVGYMYETRDQVKPVYDAKGIETVRRDGIPATVKILEKSIRLLFETKDVSLVKQYVTNQFRKVQAGTVCLQDLTFAKEFRGLKGYRPSACVPALELTKQAMKLDRRAVPRVGERVPYVVVYGEPGLPLIQLVRHPRTLLEQSHLRTNAHYYITKVIAPPLNRCLLLVGADCLAWFSELPRYMAAGGAEQGGRVAGGQIISQYFAARRCQACGEAAVKPLCGGCFADKGRAVILLQGQLGMIERAGEVVGRVCAVCCGAGGRDCVSLDCPVVYRRMGEEVRRSRVELLEKLLDNIKL